MVDGPGSRWTQSSEAGITTERLRLAPLRPDDADAMVDVLADEQLYEFIGGRAVSLDELRQRYRLLATGPSDPDEVWLNWVVRRGSDARPVGTVQATLTLRDDRWTAYVAWVIGLEWQGLGFASEAALALVEWLRRHGVTQVAANIHPDHRASAIVATRAGLLPTAEEDDGEQVWRSATRPWSDR